jgi:hypothetical protein
MALKNRDFLVLFMALLIGSAVGGTVEALQIYMNTYFWGFTPEDLRWFVIAFIGSVAAFLLIAPLQRRFDKKQLLIACLLFSLANGMVIVGLRFLDVLPANGNPMLLYVLIAKQSYVRVLTMLWRDVRLDGGGCARCAGTATDGARRACFPPHCRFRQGHIRDRRTSQALFSTNVHFRAVLRRIRRAWAHHAARHHCQARIPVLFRFRSG